MCFLRPRCSSHLNEDFAVAPVESAHPLIQKTPHFSIRSCGTDAESIVVSGAFGCRWKINFGSSGGSRAASTTGVKPFGSAETYVVSTPQLFSFSTMYLPSGSAPTFVSRTVLLPSFAAATATLLGLPPTLLEKV